jgi:hypothetical protein
VNDASAQLGLTPTHEDAVFFKRHQRRRFRIRRPAPDEFNFEECFGMHETEREAIIAVRTLAGIIRIPFLKFADEEIADNDETLKPIVDDMMHRADERFRRMN